MKEKALIGHAEHGTHLALKVGRGKAIRVTATGDRLRCVVDVHGVSVVSQYGLLNLWKVEPFDEFDIDILSASSRHVTELGDNGEYRKKDGNWVRSMDLPYTWYDHKGRENLKRKAAHERADNHYESIRIAREFNSFGFRAESTFAITGAEEDSISIWPSVESMGPLSHLEFEPVKFKGPGRIGIASRLIDECHKYYGGPLEDNPEEDDG